MSLNCLEMKILDIRAQLLICELCTDDPGCMRKKRLKKDLKKTKKIYSKMMGGRHKGVKV